MAKIRYSHMMNVATAVDEYLLTNKIDVNKVTPSFLVDCKLCTTVEKAQFIKNVCENLPDMAAFCIVFKRYDTEHTIWQDSKGSWIVFPIRGRNLGASRWRYFRHRILGNKK